MFSILYQKASFCSRQIENIFIFKHWIKKILQILPRKYLIFLLGAEKCCTANGSSNYWPVSTLPTPVHTTDISLDISHRGKRISYEKMPLTSKKKNLLSPECIKKGKIQNRSYLKNSESYRNKTSQVFFISHRGKGISCRKCLMFTETTILLT